MRSRPRHDRPLRRRDRSLTSPDDGRADPRTVALASCLAVGLLVALAVSVGTGVPEASGPDVLLPRVSSGGGGPPERSPAGTGGLGGVLRLWGGVRRKRRRIKHPKGEEAAGGVNQRRAGEHRIAIMIPYLPPPDQVTPTLPPYFPAFARTAGGSASLFDFLVFHDGSVPPHLLPPPHDPGDPHSLPPNVRLIDLGGPERMAELFLRVADERMARGELKVDKETLAKVIGRHIRGYPYVLVEFKAAYGHIFADFLKDYTHWGYSDLDVLFGDLPRWVTPDELTDYDIVTYSYGDQGRAYIRGQLTFHKNTEKTRQVWRACRFLSEIDDRFARAASGESKLRFESAEGCYSRAVLRRDDLRVKYAVKFLNDLGDTSDTAYTHGLYVGTGSSSPGDGLPPRSVVWKAGDGEGDGERLRDLPLDWYEKPGIPYTDPSNPPLQWEVGDRTPVESHRDRHGDAGKEADCMFWAPKTYQGDICVMDVEPTDTLFLMDGRLYKQRYERRPMPGNVVSLAFYHFVEWKRYYRHTQLAALRRLSGRHSPAVVVTGEGAIPLPLLPPPDPAAAPAADRRPWAEPTDPSRGGGGDDDPRVRLPPTAFCLASSRRRVPKRPAGAQCDYAVTWRDEGGSVTIVDGGATEAWRGLDAEEGVTLALTVQIPAGAAAAAAAGDARAMDGLLAAAEESLGPWDGAGQPSVLVVHVAGGDAGEGEREGAGLAAAAGAVRDRFGPLPLCLAAVVSTPGVVGPVSRKALINMAAAAAPTRWIISGLEAERGLALSAESAAFAVRAARSHNGERGSALVVPQFALRGDMPASGGTVAARVAGMLRIRGTGTDASGDAAGGISSELSEWDCAPCADPGGEAETSTEDGITRRINELWLDLTEREFSRPAGAGRVEEAGGGEDGAASVDALARSVAELRTSLISLLTEGGSGALGSFGASPVLMVDGLGPRPGVLTSEVVPEAEEFGPGPRCLDGLRLAQLAALGYVVSALPGAVALSTEGRRGAACAGGSGRRRQRDRDADGDDGGSRCGGCGFFPDRDLLEDMAYDERVRPAKAAVLWHELEVKTEVHVEAG